MRRRLLAVTLLLLPALAAARCPEGATTAAFTAPGAFGVGVRTLALFDPARMTQGQPGRTLTTEVWYPAESGSPTPVRDVALAGDGPFPLVVSSHGLLDNRNGESYVTTLLASHGFVVAAPDFPLTRGGLPGAPDMTDTQNQPGDLSFVIDELLRLSGTPGEWLEGGVKPHRIGATGLSLGAVTTLLFTYHPELRDRRVRAALPVAPGGACAFTPQFFATRRPRLLVLSGEQDLLVPFATHVAPLTGLVRSRFQLVKLVAGTHTGFAGLITFPSATSYDTIGCAAIANVGQWGDPFAGVIGVDPTPGICPLPCQDPVPSNPPMQALRQHELTRAIEVAFFESTLRRVRAARCFLREQLALENADVVSELHRPGR